MTSTPRRTAQLGVAILSLLAILVATSVPARAADPGTTATPALAAADWLATELEAKDGLLTVSFAPDPKEYVDQGLIGEIRYLRPMSVIPGLGIDPGLQIRDPVGRPHRISADNGRPIAALLQT